MQWCAARVDVRALVAAVVVGVCVCVCRLLMCASGRLHVCRKCVAAVGVGGCIFVPLTCSSAWPLAVESAVAAVLYA